MATKTVADYIRIIEKGMKKSIPGIVKTTIVVTFSSDDLIGRGIEETNTGMHLISGIRDACRQYIADSRIEENRLFGKPRKHLQLIIDLSQAINLGSKEDVMRIIVESLEQSVLEGKCNLKGNFANLCRAIVNKTIELGELHCFSKRFKDKLGIEPLSTAPSLATY